MSGKAHKAKNSAHAKAPFAEKGAIVITGLNSAKRLFEKTRTESAAKAETTERMISNALSG